MKSKVFLYMLFFMAFSFGLKAQNLVPNYSFEDTIQCIQGWNQFQGYVVDWTGEEAGLCYFTSRCNEYEDSVPLNSFGYQYAHSGKAYAGIYTFIDDTDNGSYISNNYNYRNYIQAQLLTPLTISAKYYVTFYVSLADSSWFYCNDIGAYFSDSALNYPVYTHVKSYLTPQIANNLITNPLTDTKNWIKVSGSFVALGGEKYIVIGNFKDDSNSTVVYKGEVSSQLAGAYYYIDDVIVSTDSNYADSLATVSVQNINVPKEVVKVYPNPNNGKFTLELQNADQNTEIEIYNMMGEKIYATHLPQTPKGALNQIDLSNQPAGIYLYRVVSETGEQIASGKLVIQK